MDMADDRQSELGGFLRARRDQLVRADYELPNISRNRTLGLRREEVAFLAGVSVTWYTWLEQGRDINPSRQVLDAIAGTLRLSVDEHHYILELAGYAPSPPGAMRPTKEAPGGIRRLLDAQGDSPAFALAADWGIAAWNSAYSALYPRVETVPAPERNLLYLIFMDPEIRQLLPDWESTSKQFLAEYRGESGLRVGDRSHTDLIGHLLKHSQEFTSAWQMHEVGTFSSAERRFEHPTVGELRFEYHRLAPSDAPELHLIVYLPSDSETRKKMKELLQGRSGK